MNILEKNEAGGWFEIEHWRNGVLLSKEKVHNLLMNAYPAVVAGLVGNTGGQTAFGFLALGTSATTVAKTQTGLVAETSLSGLGRTAATISRTTTSGGQTNDTVVFSNTFTAGAGVNVTINEIGVFNASSGGVMACRALTTAKLVAPGDLLICSYSIQFTN